MSIGSTRKITTGASTSKVSRNSLLPNNHSQFVENIDTNNNVLVRDENNHQPDNNQHSPQKQNQSSDFNSNTLDASTNVDTLIMSGLLEESSPLGINNKVDVYINNQSIVKDQEVERTGRNYLKHFYEKNSPPIDVDELV